MKKILLSLLAFVFCFGIFVGCDTLTPPDDGGEPITPDAPLPVIEQQYEKIGEAAEISQTIEIVSGKLVQYESKKTFKKQGDAYLVTGEIKRLNDITEETAYATETVNETLRAGEFEVRLKFDELYFSSWQVENNTLTAVINDSSVKLALGISGELPAPVHNTQLTVVTDGTHVNRIGIEYASGSSAVTIALEFGY